MKNLHVAEIKKPMVKRIAWPADQSTTIPGERIAFNINNGVAEI